eukprot:5520612-Amphidinium_carterae.1
MFALLPLNADAVKGKEWHLDIAGLLIGPCKLFADLWCTQVAKQSNQPPNHQKTGAFTNECKTSEMQSTTESSNCSPVPRNQRSSGKPAKVVSIGILRVAWDAGFGPADETKVLHVCCVGHRDTPDRQRMVRLLQRWMEYFAAWRAIDPGRSCAWLRSAIKRNLLWNWCCLPLAMAPALVCGGAFDAAVSAFCRIIETAYSLQQKEFQACNVDSLPLQVPAKEVGQPLEASDVAWTDHNTLFQRLSEALVDKDGMMMLVQKELAAPPNEWSNRPAHPFLLRLKAVRLLRHELAGSLSNGGLPDDSSGWDSDRSHYQDDVLLDIM